MTGVRRISGPAECALGKKGAKKWGATAFNGFLGGAMTLSLALQPEHERRMLSAVAHQCARPVLSRSNKLQKPSAKYAAGGGSVES